MWYSLESSFLPETMKTPRFVLLGLTLLAWIPLTGQAVKPKNGTGAALPSARLRQMIDNTLPRISSLNPKQQPNRTALVEVHAQWTALAQTAPAAQQPIYAAAANVAQSLISAVDEHTKAIADFHYSKSVHGAPDKKDLEISNAGQAPGTAWANNAKQNKENADSKRAVKEKEEFMNKAAVEEWKVRMTQISTTIEQAYTAELVTEKQAVVARPATPAPAPSPGIVPSPASAAEAYSPVGEWTAPKGKWTLSDDGKFTAANGGKGTWQWSDRAKRELDLKWLKLGDGKAAFSVDGRTLEVTLPKGGQVTLTR
jgi:hypothetical protein